MRNVAYLGAVLCLAVSSGLSATGQEEKLKELRGTIRELDLKTGALILQPPGEDKPVALSLAAKELPITDSLGAKLSLADLRPEQRIVAKLRADDEVVAIRMDGPYQHGTVKKVDVAGRIIIYKDVFAEKTLVVPAEMKIVVLGKEQPLDQFKPGDPIQFLYSLDKKRIVQIQTGKGTHARDPYLRVARHYGILTDLDSMKRTTQIFVQSLDAGVVKNYDISPDAYLRTMYHFKPVAEVGFEQFAKWIKVHYFVDRDTGKIINIDADLPVMARRKVLKVDAKAGQITVEDAMKEKTLLLAAEVKVYTPRGDGKVADIAVNRIINCGLSLDRSRVEIVYMWDR